MARRKLRNKLRWMHDAEQMRPIKEEISRLSDEMAKIRKDMRICMDIAERHGVVEAVVNTIFAPEQKKNEKPQNKQEERNK